MDKPGLDGQTVVERILKRGNIPMEVLNNDQLAHRYPMLRCSSNMKGILEEFGGVLLADRARQTLQAGNSVELCVFVNKYLCMFLGTI